MLRSIERGKGLLFHINLAAHLEDFRMPGPGQLLRDVGNMLHVRRDVLPHLAITTGGRTHEPATLVAQRAGEAVDLVLGGEGEHGVLGQREKAPHPPCPFLDLLGREGVVEAHHPRCVAHLRERRGGDLVAHSRAWAVRTDKLGKGGFELGVAAHQGIIFRVGDFGRVIGMVEPVVVRDRLGQPHELVGGSSLAARIYFGHARAITVRIMARRSRKPSLW